jgi:hypothetical protein
MPVTSLLPGLLTAGILSSLQTLTGLLKSTPSIMTAKTCAASPLEETTSSLIGRDKDKTGK